MTDQERIAQLEREAESMLGIQAGLMLVISSLIATHQDYQKLNLHLAGSIEHIDTAYRSSLSDRGLQSARSTAEWLLRTEEVRGEIDLLGQFLRGTGRPKGS